ncbi:MAG: DUF1559 domain-containing protein, partial [Thermoguttaceae bacterium]|nr:DUF1559 domain-containing protein [Thermoguttaceae bacterium]
AARRMQCTNNLKQIGLATLNYVEKGQVFPLQYWGRGDNNQNWSCMTVMFPYMEQISLYDELYSAKPPKTRAPWCAGDANGAVWRTKVPTLLCPSDGAGLSKPSNAPAPNNYRFCQGDWAYPGTGTGLNQGRGVVGMTTHLPFAGVTDGTSNTILVSEHGITGSNFAHVVAGSAIVPGVFDGSGRLANPQLCLSARVDGQTLGGTGVTVVPVHNGGTDRGYPTNSAGVSYGDGATYFMTFQTILPPNSPTCGVSSPQPQNSRALVPPTSYHSGGVNAVFCDGSVRFISETIDCGSALNQPPGTSVGAFPSGKSKYGVWGACGTPQAGESTSL